LINFKYIISILLLLNNVYVYSKIYIYIYIINKKDILPPTGKKDKSGNNVLQDIGLKIWNSKEVCSYTNKYIIYN